MNITDQQFRIYDRVLATVSAFAIIIGGVWSFYRFIQAKENENKLIREQINLSKYNDKKAIYYELCEAAGEIATCNSYNEVVIAQRCFRKLYVGKAHIIAGLDESVNCQKIDFFDLLIKYLREKPDTCPFDYFQCASLQLSDSCRTHLAIDSIYK